MQPMTRFEPTTATQLHALISDLRWRIQMLDADIGEEEHKARIFDPQDPAYPMLALTLRARRRNLRASIATLEGRPDSEPNGRARAA
jgi:hypothetical protein